MSIKIFAIIMLVIGPVYIYKLAKGSMSNIRHWSEHKPNGIIYYKALVYASIVFCIIAYSVFVYVMYHTGFLFKE